MENPGEAAQDALLFYTACAGHMIGVSINQASVVEAMQQRRKAERSIRRIINPRLRKREDDARDAAKAACRTAMKACVPATRRALRASAAQGAVMSVSLRSLGGLGRTTACAATEPHR